MPKNGVFQASPAQPFGNGAQLGKRLDFGRAFTPFGSVLGGAMNKAENVDQGVFELGEDVILTANSKLAFPIVNVNLKRRKILKKSNIS